MSPILVPLRIPRGSQFQYSAVAVVIFLEKTTANEVLKETHERLDVFSWKLVVLDGMSLD